jgi:hypothetical protein
MCKATVHVSHCIDTTTYVSHTTRPSRVLSFLLGLARAHIPIDPLINGVAHHLFIPPLQLALHPRRIKHFRDIVKACLFAGMDAFVREDNVVPEIVVFQVVVCALPGLVSFSNGI